MGGSGILAQRPRGVEIDEAEAVFRVNNCPVRGFEDLVGGRTTFRFLNSPRSMMWARDVKGRQESRRKGVAVAPPELEGNDFVIIWGSEGTRARLASSLPPNASVVRHLPHLPLPPAPPSPSSPHAPLSASHLALALS